MYNPHIEVNHKLLLENLKIVQAALETDKHKKPKVMAVVKSNAYGHGMIEIAKTLDSEVDMFGVGTLSEGVLLSKANVAKKILVMGPSYDFETAHMHSLIITIENLEQLNMLCQYCRNHESASFDVHFKLDTGMHRFGFTDNEIDEALSLLSDQIRLTGVFSHMLGTPFGNKRKVEVQLENFKSFQQVINKWYRQNKDIRGLEKPCYHLANSENAIDLEEARFDMVRIGNALFGPTATLNKLPLKRIGKVKCPVMSIHEHKKGEWIGYGHKHKLNNDTLIAVCMGGFFEGNGLMKAPIGLNKMNKIHVYLKELVKSLLRKDLVTCNGFSYEVVGSMNMQFIQVDISKKPIGIGDYIEVNKSPLYFDSSLERLHILEERHAIN